MKTWKKIALALAAVLFMAATPKIAGNVFTADKVVAPQVAKAGAVFNGATASCPAGVCVVGDGFNVTSVTWTGTGRYTVELTAALSSATTYTIIPASGSGDKVLRWTITDADTFNLECDNSLTQAAADCSISFVVFDF